MLPGPPHIMQLVLVKSQEPDLPEAWEVRRDTKTFGRLGQWPCLLPIRPQRTAFIFLSRALAAMLTALLAPPAVLPLLSE